MTSDRVQRRIDALLDEADEAITGLDWETVRGRARAVLALEEDHADAKAYLESAERQLAPSEGSPSAPLGPDLERLTGDLSPSLDRTPALFAEVIKALCQQARVAYHSGDMDAAGRKVGDMLARMADSPGSAEVDDHRLDLRVLGNLGEVAVPFVTPEFMRAAMRHLEEDWGYRPAWAMSEANDAVRGWYALALDEVDTAEAAFQKLAWTEEDGLNLYAGRARQGLAEVAIRRGDTAEAMRHLDRAQELFHEHRIQLYLDQVIAKKLELQGASDDSTATIDMLTRTLEVERPNITSHAAPDGTVTLLFSDIEGSTALNVALGDDAWVARLAEHNRLVRAAIAEHGGYEVKTEGECVHGRFRLGARRAPLRAGDAAHP